MSIRSVKKQIRAALADQKITKAEADHIIETAQKGPLTTGEAKTIANTFERLDNPPMFSLPPPGVQVQWPTFESMTPKARESFTNFFVDSRIPAGDNKANIRDAIKRSVKEQGLTQDKRLDCAPNAKHLHTVFINDGIGLMNAALLDTAKQEFYIETASRGAEFGANYYGPFKLEQKPSVQDTSDAEAGISKRLEYFDFSNKLDAAPAHLGKEFLVSDDRPVDGPLIKAYLDSANDQYYVAYEAARMLPGNGPSGPSYYGPFDTNHVFKPTPIFPTGPSEPVVNPRAITDVTIADIKSSWSSNESAATFRPGFNVPMGISFDRVELSNDAERGIADGYVYTALVPSGSQNPFAPAGSGPNPNDVSYYFVERSGGFAGLTETAGPFDK